MQLLVTFLVAFSALQLAIAESDQDYNSGECDVSSSPKSWASIDAHNVFFYAVEAADDLNNTNFCATDDFMSNTITVNAHIDLYTSPSTLRKDHTNASDLATSNCAGGRPDVMWCKGHCADTALLNRIVNVAVTNGSLPLAVAEEIYEELGSPVDWTVVALQIDQSKANILVNYDYYNDKNFCSVNIKVKKNLQFPYTLLIQAVKILVN